MVAGVVASKGLCYPYSLQERMGRIFLHKKKDGLGRGDDDDGFLI